MLKIADPRMSGNDNDTMLPTLLSLSQDSIRKKGCVSTNALAAGVRRTHYARAPPHTRAMPGRLVCNHIGRAHHHAHAS